MSFRFHGSDIRITIGHHIYLQAIARMIGNTHSLRFVLSASAVLVLFTGSVAQAAQPTGLYPYLIEVFATTDLPVTGGAVINRKLDYPEINIQDFELDGIQRFEANLSKGLTADPEQAKLIVLSRIQQLDESSRARLQHAAMGLVKAMQYGIRRYPAIVFDGEVAVYGVTDLHEALLRYQQWRKGLQP